MIKQNFNMNSDEIVRILKMHENATKNHYLIKEQVRQTQTLEPKTFQLPAQTFASGYHSANSLNPNQKEQITGVLNQIADYLKKYKGVPMEIQITTGESQPTNFDKENNKKLNSGQLADLRGQTVTKIIEDFFNGLVKSGQLPSMPKIPKYQTQIGKTPKGLDPNDPKYQAEQFIRFSVVASGEVTTECLVGLKIMFVYLNRKDDQIPCRGDHFCDEAVFDVYLNKTKVGVANLNNGGCQGEECNRRSIIQVTPEMVNSIVNNPDFEKKKQLVLWYSCASQMCHSSIPEIYISNKDGKQLFPNTNFPSPCVATGSKKGDKGPWALMVLDGCGNPIQMSVQASNAEMKAIQDQIAAEEEEKRKKEEEKARQDREAAEALTKEQLAKIQRILEYGKTNGLEMASGGSNNKNVFAMTNFFQVLEERAEGNFFVAKIKNITRNKVAISFIKDPETGSPMSLVIPGGSEIILKYPLYKIDINVKKKRFSDQFMIPKIDEEGNYYFVDRKIGFKDQTPENIRGSVLEPNFI
jgi:hypothetical protein